MPIIERHTSYFRTSSMDFHEVIWKAKWFPLMERLGFTPTMLLSEMEEKRALIDEMKKDFASRKTPDRMKTIKDRLQMITTRVKKEIGYNLDKWPSSSFGLGYQLAIRGVDPTLWELGTKYWSNYDTIELLGEVSAEDYKMFTAQVLEGYATCFFETWLEKELNAKPERSSTSAPTKKATNAKPKKELPMIRWTGQNNQLYSIIQQFIALGLVKNTQAELAEILKGTFDTFSETKVSTIEKELGRKQDLPKSRRIDIKI